MPELSREEGGAQIRAQKIEGEEQSTQCLPSPSSCDLLRRRTLPAGGDRNVRDILRLNDGRHVWIGVGS